MSTQKISTPPLTEQARLNKLIDLSLTQAQKELEAGTASSQVLTHFLRISSTREEIELEKLRLETKLIEAKIESEKTRDNLANLVEAGLAALKSYTVTIGIEDTFSESHYDDYDY